MGAPWFKIWSKELLADSKIILLEDDQLGKLLKLWCYASQDGSIPSNPVLLAKLLGGATKKQMVKHLVWVNQFFCLSEDGQRLISHRLLSEYQAYETKCEKLRGNGALGGRPKKPNGLPDGFEEEKPNGLPDGEPKENQMGLELRREKKERDKESTTVPTKPARTARTLKPKPEGEGLEQILDGGKGTPTWEAYWTLVATFGGQPKNFAPKTTARLYVAALKAGTTPAHIQDRAQLLRNGTDDVKYLPQLAKWLEGQGYLTPDLPAQAPPTNGQKSYSRATGADAATERNLIAMGYANAPKN